MTPSSPKRREKCKHRLAVDKNLEELRIVAVLVKDLRLQRSVAEALGEGIADEVFSMQRQLHAEKARADRYRELLSLGHRLMDHPHTCSFDIDRFHDPGHGDETRYRPCDCILSDIVAALGSKP